MKPVIKIIVNTCAIIIAAIVIAPNAPVLLKGIAYAIIILLLLIGVMTLNARKTISWAEQKISKHSD